MVSFRLSWGKRKSLRTGNLAIANGLPTGKVVSVEGPWCDENKEEGSGLCERDYGTPGAAA